MATVQFWLDIEYDLTLNKKYESIGQPSFHISSDDVIFIVELWVVCMIKVLYIEEDCWVTERMNKLQYADDISLGK